MAAALPALREEFFVIARTFLDVYPNVVVWRGDFFPTKPIVALAGYADDATLSLEGIDTAGRHLSDGLLPGEAYKAVVLPFYAGNLGKARHLVPEGSVNTDDRPLVEYLTPVAHRRVRSGAESWFHMEALADFYDALAEAVPPERDPYLAALNERDRDYVRAGLSYYKGAVLEELGSDEAAEELFRDFEGRIPPGLRPDTDEEVGLEFEP